MSTQEPSLHVVREAAESLLRFLGGVIADPPTARKMIARYQRRDDAGGLDICDHLATAERVDGLVDLVPVFWCTWSPSRVCCPSCAGVDFRTVLATRGPRCDFCPHRSRRIMFVITGDTGPTVLAAMACHAHAGGRP